MKISVKSLFDNRGSSLDFRETFSITDLNLLDEIGVISADEALVYGKIKSYGTSLMINFTVEIQLKKRCDRCLCEYDEFVQINSERKISSIDEGNINDITVENGELDFEELVIDELLSQLPTQSLCDDDCSGLCTECGADLNEVECNCNKNKIDPRFASLVGLFKENN